METSTMPLEIERKYLIKYPDLQQLSKVGCRSIDITQIYLARGPLGESRRVRKSISKDSMQFTYNEKRKISGFTRIELEHEISEEEYSKMSAERDTTLNIISKTRWLLPYKDHLFEIDVYPFWDDRAIMEVELKSEEESFVLPEQIEIIRDVTFDDAYLNTSLAKSVVYEDIY